jgi:hypothetical protein
VKRFSFFITAATLFLLPLSGALAKPGDYDASFSGDGVVTTSPFNLAAPKIALSPNGRTIYHVAACTETVSSQRRVCITVIDAADGSVISTNNTGPTANVSVSEIADVAVESKTGALYVLAACQPLGFSPGSCVLRFSANATHDASFQSALVAGVSFVVNGLPAALKIRQDGRVSVLATLLSNDPNTNAAQSRVALRSFTSTGAGASSPGSGFNQIWLTSGSGSNQLDVAKDFVILPDGSLVFLYDCPTSAGTSAACIQRMLANGNVGGPIERLPFPATESPKRIFLAATEPAPNAYRLLIASTLVSSPPILPAFRLLTLTNGANTSLVSEWGGPSFPGLAAPSNANTDNQSASPAFLWGHDNRVYVVTCEGASTSTCLTTVRRVNSTGTEYETGWGPIAGVVAENVVFPSLALQRDGKLLIGGTSAAIAGQSRVVRLVGDLYAKRGCTGDIDGDGVALPTTDGVILTRVSLGLSGSAVIANAVVANATRTTWAAIRDHLAIDCGMQVTP